MAKGNKDARAYVKMQSSEKVHGNFLQNTAVGQELRKNSVVRRHLIYREGKR